MDSPGMLKWAEAIKIHEGWYPGSRSYRNNNPGNFRYPVGSSYIRSLGATGVDSGGMGRYAIFPDYQTGWNALLQFLRDARANQLISYRKYATDRKRYANMCTLNDFFQVYAPSGDSNNPNAYALYVAKRIGVPITTPINRI